MNAVFVAPDAGSPAVGHVGAGASEVASVRRCPVGVISSLDCPELAGLACCCFEPRGGRAPQVVPRSELGQLVLELSRDYLTAAYVRRLRPLRHGLETKRGSEILAAAPVVAGADGPPVPRRIAGAMPGVPVNVPSDHANRAARLRRGPRQRGAQP